MPIRRIGIIGDVHTEHASLSTALSAIIDLHVDVILCAGDIVDGTGSVDACCALLQEHDVVTVRGNHERWLCAGSMRDLPNATRTGEILELSLNYLASLKQTQTIATPLGDLLLCHGLGSDDMLAVTPDDYGYSLEVNSGLQSLLFASQYRLVVNGHTHQRMVRSFGKLTIVNAGTLRQGDAPCFGVIDMPTRRVQFYDLPTTSTFIIADSYVIPSGRKTWAAKDPDND